MSCDDGFPSRKSNEGSNKYISVLLARLAELEKQTNPAGGDETAKGKDLAAFEALSFAGDLVGAVAGWAIDHQCGLAQSGLKFVPLQPSGTKDHPEYRDQRAEVDRHGHESEGAAVARSLTFDPRVARNALYNLVLANPGGFPSGLQQLLLQALRALDYGEATPIFQPEAEHRKRSYQELRLQLEALGFVEYRVGTGYKKQKAQEDVAVVFGVATETIRTWEKRLRDEFGRLEVSRTLWFAKNAGNWTKAATADLCLPDNLGEAHHRIARNEQRYGDDALVTAGQAYRNLLGFTVG